MSMCTQTLAGQGRLAEWVAETSPDRTPSRPAGERSHAVLVRRVNQLYHDLTQDVFDLEHRYRHRVERRFWLGVARLLDGGTSARALSRTRTILDVACGTGFVTRILADALNPRDRLLAMDISAAALASTARKCSQRRIGRSVGDGAALPLADESVDLVAINAALHHMPEPAAVLAEIDRVLMPAGLLVLGFEPNLQHFRSPMARFSSTFDRLAWYASPRQNLRRLRTLLGLDASNSRLAGGQDCLARQINTCLLGEGLIHEALATHAILDMVDPHARGADEHAGFDPALLIRESLGDYQLVQHFTSDYLGETPRRCRPLRAVIDATLRAAWPEHGSLFCLIVRKPARARGKSR